MTADFWFGLERFNDLFGYLPVDIISYVLVCLAVLLVLGLRRVLY